VATHERCKTDVQFLATKQVFVRVLDKKAELVALGEQVRDEGPQQMIAGDWDAGVGIGLRADMLGVTFALLSLGVLLAALIFEVCNGVRSQSFPALVLLLGAGLTGGGNPTPSSNATSSSPLA